MGTSIRPKIVSSSSGLIKRALHSHTLSSNMQPTSPPPPGRATVLLCSICSSDGMPWGGLVAPALRPLMLRQGCEAEPARATLGLAGRLWCATLVDLDVQQGGDLLAADGALVGLRVIGEDVDSIQSAALTRQHPCTWWLDGFSGTNAPENQCCSIILLP